MVMSRDTFTKAVISGKVTSSQISKLTKGGTLGGSLGNLMTQGGTVKVAGFSAGALTAKQVQALPVNPLKKALPTRLPTNFPSDTPPDYGGIALGIGDVALDLSPVGIGMGILSDVGNLAGLSMNALGLGSKKKGGNMVYDGRSRPRRKGASYWRNRYEAMYWKAKYETARYGHGRMK